MSKQFIDVLAAQLRSAARFNSAVQVAPAAILWTDEERQWQSAMPVIKQAIPELIELGDYEPATRTGPAIWIKCAIAGLADELKLADGVVPVIYLPGVSRKDLRAIEQCPEHLQPLAELQYRGCWWAYNSTGRDWSVSAFLTTDTVDLGLDIAKDKRTQDAIQTVLSELLESPAETLQGRRLDSDDFYALVVEDPIKDLLGWLNDPETKKAQWPANKWSVFCEHCQQQYGFDPQQGMPEQKLSELCVADPSNSVFYDYYHTQDKNLTINTSSIIEGIGRPRVESSFVSSVIDSMVKVPDEAAFATLHFLSGIINRRCGGSTGTNLYAAFLKIHEMNTKGVSGSVVSMICDSGDRYSDTYYNKDWLSAKGYLLKMKPYTSELNNFYETGMMSSIK